MTIIRMNKKNDMIPRCMEHAQSSFRDGVRKGLDLDRLADVMMVEIFRQSWGADDETAFDLAKAATAYALEYLQKKRLSKAEAQGEDMDILNNEMTELKAQREDWLNIDIDVVEKIDEKRANGLLGSTSLTPPKAN